MNLPIFIAKRYFFSRKKSSFISLISIISMLGVCIGTMALVVVLSVFNGLEDFQRKLFKNIDSDLKVSSSKGKKFECPRILIQQIAQVEGVKNTTEVIQENALLRYNKAQMVVTLKGVDENFLKQERLKSSLVDGELKLGASGVNYALVGSGVAYLLGIDLDAYFIPIEALYPHNNNSKTIDFYATDAFNQANLLPAGVFTIEQEFDNSFVFVPLAFAQELFEYGNKRSALEIQVRDKNELTSVQKRLKTLLGDTFIVQNQDEQHASLLKAIKIEKLFVFLTLSFIIGIASFNIFFSLSMLAIEKKQDVKTLYAMGATPTMIRRIFLSEGALVAFMGASIGLILGFGLCLAQQTYGFVSMGIVGSLVDAYPIKMVVSDFVYTAIVVIIITLLASYFPAKKASKTSVI